MSEITYIWQGLNLCLLSNGVCKHAMKIIVSRSHSFYQIHMCYHQKYSISYFSTRKETYMTISRHNNSVHTRHRDEVLPVIDRYMYQAEFFALCLGGPGSIPGRVKPELSNW